MSDDDGTCEYVLDPDDPETWGGEEGDSTPSPPVKVWEILNEDDVWTCPHHAEDHKELCIFHLPINEKDDKAVVDAFLNIIETVSESTDPKSQRRNLQFLGARFGTFKLSEYLSEFVFEEGGIFLSYATIEGDFQWSATTFSMKYLHLEKVTFSGDIELSQVKFGGETYLKDSIFKGEADFTQTEFSGDADFSFAEFRERATFSNAVFNGVTTFESAEFRDETDFSQTRFEVATESSIRKVDGLDILFTGVTFRERSSFNEAVFQGNTDFGDLSLRSANFVGAEFQGDVFFRDAECQMVIDFRKTVFSGMASFIGVEFGGRMFVEGELKGEVGGGADFTDVSFEEEADFSGSALECALFDSMNLTDAIFSNARLCNAVFESARLSRATLSGANLRGAKLSGAVLGDVQIDENTEFLGHPSDYSDDDASSMLDTLSELRSGNYCVYDPRYEGENKDEDIDSAKSVYRALEELAGRAARPQLQSRCFVNRQDLQRKQYRESIGKSENPLEWVTNIGKWIRAKVARTTLLYGESPWRVIGWSLGIIFSFALLYPLGGWMKPTDGTPITYAQIASNPAEILNSVYYSTLTYTALGFGDFKPVGLGKALTTVETGLGAVLIALLVFVLGRRAAR